MLPIVQIFNIALAPTTAEEVCVFLSRLVCTYAKYVAEGAISVFNILFAERSVTCKHQGRGEYRTYIYFPIFTYISVSKVGISSITAVIILSITIGFRVFRMHYYTGGNRVIFIKPLKFYINLIQMRAFVKSYGSSFDNMFSVNDYRAIFNLIGPLSKISYPSQHQGYIRLSPATIASAPHPSVGPTP